MTSGWPHVAIKDIAKHVQRPEQPIAGRTYRQLGVRLWGQGAYERELLEGSQTRYATLSRVEYNDIVVNKIWARNGSVAVVPPSLAGCYVSVEFPTFVPYEKVLEPRWFHWLTKTREFWEQCDKKSRGTSGKNRIKPDLFLTIEIPLPPLCEQQRIIARIEELAAKINEACALRQQAANGTSRLVEYALREFACFPLTDQYQLSSIAVEGGTNLFASEYPSSTYLSLEDVEAGTGRIIRQRSVSSAGIKGTAVEFAAGDVLYSKLRPYLNKVVAPDFDGLATTEFVVLKPNTRLVSAPFLALLLRSPQTVELLVQNSSGTKMPRTNLKVFRSMNLPVPPLSTQLIFVSNLSVLQEQAKRVGQLQTETNNELDAMLPAVLDKAFKGKL